MPIPQETAKVSVDFPYIWDNPVDGTKETYQLRFIHNDFGPVLQIAQGPYEPVELPAIMFLEVAEFLVRNNYIKGMPTLSQPKAAGSLPIPNIGRKLRPGVDAPPAARTTMGLGSFAGPPTADDSTNGDNQEDAGAAQIAAVTAEKPTAAPVSPEEAQKLLQARLAAKAKANTAGKKFRSNPKYETGGA